MKIILTNQAHPNFGGPGGAERSVKSLAEGLAHRGHDVISLAMAPKAQTEHLSVSGIHSEHRISGVKTILLGKVSGSATEVEMMTSIIERERPDVVHTNTFWHNTDLWREVARLGIPIVHSLREYKLLCASNMYKDDKICAELCEACQLPGRVNRVRSELVSAVVGISRYVLDRHLQLGLFKGVANRTVIHNSVSGRAPEGFSPQPTNGPLRLGYLGRIHPTKGVASLMDAILNRTDDHVRLLLAGEVQAEDMAHRISQANGDPRFEYLGFVDPSELFAQIDALVVPSAWPEPFGRIVVEAYLHGIPVLAANRGGLPELIRTGETGWTFGEGGPSLEVAIETILGERQTLADMHDACLRAADNYRPSVIAEQYERTYQQAVDAARPAPARVVAGFRERLFHNAIGKTTKRRRSLPTVLVVTGEFPKLSETFVINHITGLIDEGAEVTVFAERPGAADQWHVDVDKYGLMNRCLWYGMPNSLKHARDYLTAGSRDIQRSLAKLMEGATLIGMPPPLDELARLLGDEQARTEVKLRLFHAAEVLNRAQKSFDIVHCHFGHRGLFAAELKKMGVLEGKIAVSFHGIDLTEHLHKGGVHVYDRLRGEADALLPISNFFRERLLKLGFSPRRTHVHHVGVSCEKFAFQARFRPEGEAVRLLTVGRLVPKKGVEYVLRALGLLKQKGRLKLFHYDIVGDGPERKTLEALCEKLGLKDHVTFHGGLSHEKVADWMRSADLFISPSVTAANGDMEGIPTTIMEAMASGMPVVSTIHSGIPELVQDGESGFLCRERDFEQLAEKIRFLCQNRELWAEIGREGRKTVEAEFNIRTQNARVLRLYDELHDPASASAANMEKAG
ncbi:MAG: glycosyltransferase [Dehalococcoidia bacterium]